MQKTYVPDSKDALRSSDIVTDVFDPWSPRQLLCKYPPVPEIIFFLQYIDDLRILKAIFIHNIVPLKE